MLKCLTEDSNKIMKVYLLKNIKYRLMQHVAGDLLSRALLNLLNTACSGERLGARRHVIDDDLAWQRIVEHGGV